jgi:hypothetical protein
VLRLFQCLFVVCLALSSRQPIDAADPVFDGKRAFSYLEAICDLGPRISGSPGMTAQQELLEKHFTQLGAQVRFQEFDVPHPTTGQPVRMRNLLVVWDPQASERVLLCCHYDTRPRPDQELIPAHRDKPFIGANDGASGVAVLMELGQQFAAHPPQRGVDFVFFDGEELVYNKNDKYFLGSEKFATEYRDHPPQGFRYSAGVLLDLVAGKNITFFYEKNSLRYAPDLTRSIWETAGRLGVREFVPRSKHLVLDDHLALNQIAKIPSCDIIDFDYPHWHKRNDLPAACSEDSLAKVGRVLLAWLAGQ